MTDRGRETATVTVAFEEALLEQVDEHAVRNRESREMAVQELLGRWLQRPEDSHEL